MECFVCGGWPRFFFFFFTYLFKRNKFTHTSVYHARQRVKPVTDVESNITPKRRLILVLLFQSCKNKLPPEALLDLQNFFPRAVTCTYMYIIMYIIMYDRIDTADNWIHTKKNYVYFTRIYFDDCRRVNNRDLLLPTAEIGNEIIVICESRITGSCGRAASAAASSCMIRRMDSSSKEARLWRSFLMFFFSSYTDM